MISPRSGLSYPSRDRGSPVDESETPSRFDSASQGTVVVAYRRVSCPLTEIGDGVASAR